MATQSDLDKLKIIEAFTYDGQTGDIRWAIDVGQRARKGQLAGWNNKNGYKEVKYLGKCYKLHRIAWLLTHLEWPNGYIDHIDGNRSNNRIINLRVVDPLGNSRNAGLRKDSSSGSAGVSWHIRIKKWQARIQNGDGTRKHLGYFENIDDASAAYESEKLRLGFNHNHGIRESWNEE
jgi:hypothetical protein